jgi:hypothetical protein
VRRLTVAVLAGVFLAASLALAGPALAHPDRTSAALADAATAVIPASPPAEVRAAAGANVSWLLPGILAALVLGTLRPRPRRTLALLVALVLGVFVVENGVHSVHHLGERAANCAAAAAAGHVVAATDDGAPVLHARVVVLPLPADRSADLPSDPGLGHDPARAPPAPIA